MSLEELRRQRRERIAFELERLREAGFTVKGPEAVPEVGPYEVEITPRDHDPPSGSLTVRFPEFFPFFRFEVYAKDLSLAHHQNPFGKNLCLLGSEDEWRPQDDTVLSFIEERLPLAISAGLSTSPGEVAEVELGQAEPFSEYFTCQAGAGFLVDGSWSLPDGCDWGELVIGLPESEVRREDRPIIRGVVLKVLAADGTQLASLDPALASKYPVEQRGRWIRLSAPQFLQPEPLFEELSKLGGWEKPPKAVKNDWGSTVMLAMIAPEEHAWREENGLGWVFTLKATQKTKKVGKRHRGRIPPPSPIFFHARAGRVGFHDRSERIPELRGLEDHKVTVFGLGSIGAPAAISLAQAGVGALSLVDHDIVDPAGVVRWPLGVAQAFYPKTHVIQAFIEHQYPLTGVTHETCRLGDIDGFEGKFLRSIDGTSMVVEATGNETVQLFLSYLCRSLGIPLVVAWGTLGGYGGLVARVSDGTGCMWCLLRWLEEGSIPLPPVADPAVGRCQPSGCGSPTFTGAGFDMHTLGLAVGRTVAGYLSDYPDSEADVVVFQFRTPEGHSAISSTSYRLALHEECPYCSPNLR